jgi:NADPH-dependent glutamate synthase beta subunit-like oxidoreductase
MGHEVTVYERRKKLGGMLRYGIPLYRLPDSYLDNDIDAILSMGVDVKMGVDIGKDITIKEIFDNSDAVFVTIGAHFDKKLRLENEDAEGVLSAVQLLGDMGDDNRPDFTGKTVVVVGGGNVAMDATRTSIRLGAKNVKCVYRRRILDMTALPEEIEGAIAEGADVVELMAPASVEVDAQGKAAALIGQPQMIGEVSRGRPMPVKANKPEVRIEADIIVVAIGQAINSKHFGDFDIPLQWDQLTADRTAAVPGKPGVFAGGDCVSGPSTVIKAIEAGKVAAGNIDEYLGFNNPIRLDVKIPHATHNYQRAAGRVNAMEREAEMRKHDFDLMELPISVEEEKQEARRCLRCDHFGLGAFRGGRVQQW